MYRLRVYSSGVVSQDNAGRSIGHSVRCVAKDYLQDFSSSDASAMAVGDTKTLTDKRDGQDYMIGKLADGNVWLLDNLRLGAEPLKEILSTSNTNMSPDVAFTLPTSSTTSRFNSYTAAQINTAYANTVASTTYGNASGKIGVYYNYCAASAGTICTSSNSSSASYDICPSGWMMPYGNTANKSYYYLYDGNPTNFRNALSTPLSGYYYSSSADDQGSNGYFWSSTYGDSYSMYRLGVDSSNVYPQDYSTRDSGFSVRCVAK